MTSKLIGNTSEEAQSKMSEVFDWFNSNVSRLESAYNDIGVKFDKIRLELNEKNTQLVDSFVENEEIKIKLKAVLGSINSGVVMISEEGKITLFNTAAEKIYGLKDLDVLGKAYADVFDKGKEIKHGLLESLKTKKDYVDKERYWKIKNRLIPIGYTTSIVRDPRGVVLGAVEISTDLTQMKQMQNQVQHSKTLAALGQMAATVAHEIRNPLGAIGGFAGLLERDLDVNDSRRTLVSKIVQGVSSLNKIVSNLLVFSRPMELQIREVNFIEWIDEILRYAEIEIIRLEKSIELTRKFSHNNFSVHIDPEKFQQVFLNLLFNAIQSIKGQGSVSVQVTIEPDDFLVVSIKDTGEGIANEFKEKIFDPFFTTKEQGTGLGLAIVKRIIDLHGGTITVESYLGEWTEFKIKLDLKGAVVYG